MSPQTPNPKLAHVQQLIASAEANLQAAKQALAELTGAPAPAAPVADYSQQAATVGQVAADGRVIEGVFDGKDMIGPDQRKYPVPANYASKSKLVAGDVLKLTITEDGSYIYKQIGPVARRKMIGTLTQEGNQYKVLADGKEYSVLLASVTYFKAQPGSKLSVIVPEGTETDWAAVDNLIVASDDGSAAPAADSADQPVEADVG